MDLSVVLVALNGREMTLDCLATLKGAAAGLDYETLLVDNGSTDGTADAVEAKFGIRVIRNGENRGYGPAANQGMREASGRIVALVNNDTRLAPGSLRSLVEFLDRTPACGIVGPQLLHEDGRSQHSFDVEPGLATELLNKSLLRRLRPGAYPSRLQDRGEPFAVENLVGACFVVRRSLIEELGGFDEAYVNGGEDVDLCFRARAAGRVNAVALRSVVRHHVSSAHGRKLRDEENSYRLARTWQREFVASAQHATREWCRDYLADMLATPRAAEYRLAFRAAAHALRSPTGDPRWSSASFQLSRNRKGMSGHCAAMRTASSNPFSL